MIEWLNGTRFLRKKIKRWKCNVFWLSCLNCVTKTLVSSLQTSKKLSLSYNSFIRGINLYSVKELKLI